MERAERFWDSMAKNQDKDIEKFREISDRLVENTLKYLKKTDKVLDIGCGTGEKSIEISKYVEHVLAFDISQKAIEIARGKADKGKVDNVEFVKAVVEADILAKGSYDVILAYNIIHALEDDKKAMKRMNELLKPGGYLIMNTPCLGEKMSITITLQFIPYKILSKLGIIPLKVRMYKFKELEDLFINNGIEVLEKEKMFQGMHSYFIAGKKRS